VVAACGRIGFDTVQPDDAPPPASGHLVALTTAMDRTTQVLQLTIPDVTAGDLLIVALSIHDGTAVTQVVNSNGTALTSAGARAVKSATASELWYAAGSEPTTGVTITMAAMSSFDVWVAELSGIANGPPEAIAHGCLSYPPDVEQAPAATSLPNQLVFSVTMLAYPVFISTILPPFTALPPLSGNGAAYYFAPEAGSYAPSWQIGSGAGMTAMTCSSTAAFALAP
jgi:hypothetical protein